MVQVLSSSSSLFFFPGKNKIYCNNKGPHCAKKGPTGQYHLCSRPQLGKRCAEIATLAQSLVMSCYYIYIYIYIYIEREREREGFKLDFI